MTEKAKMVSVAKRTMNFVRHQSSFNFRKMLPLVLVLVIAFAAFIKAGFLDQLNKKALAYNALSAKQEQLAQINARLADYDALEQQYSRYSYSVMTETESNLVSRMEVLTLVEKEIAPNATIIDFAVNNNVLTMNLCGITLQEAGEMVSALESSELVDRASINSATADDGKEARIFISITLRKETE